MVNKTYNNTVRSDRTGQCIIRLDDPYNITSYLTDSKSSLGLSFIYRYYYAGKYLKLSKYEMPLTIKAPIFPKININDLVYNLLINLMNIVKARKQLVYFNTQSKYIKALILSNFEVNKDKFITLTFDRNCKFNVYDLKTCNIRKQNAIKLKFQARFGNFKYIIVPERQKDGAIHYHMIAKLPFLSVLDKKSLWPYGFMDVRAVDNLDKSAFYLTKYMAKNYSDKSLNGRKFFRSNNLIEPLKFYSNQNLFDYIPMGNHKTRSYEINTVTHGIIKNKEYLLI